ncbi:MAG TPA: hypothetical protein PLL77_03655 [Pyrinomonadaceae bacterium]|nr:hypothetical protein [Pyrinomonadaceae bacterium]
MKTVADIKSSIKQFNPVRKTINLFDPNLKETSTTFFQLADESGDKFRLFVFSERLIIESTIKTFLLFSINLPDIVCFANTLLGVSMHGHKIYASSSTDQNVLNCVTLVEPNIQDFGFEKNEGLFVFRNAIQLVCDGNRNLAREILLLKQIKLTIEDNFPENNLDFNTSNIPSELRDLLPFLAEWAIADDLERAEKIARSSKQERKILTDRVSPKIGLINNYLESFEGKPLSYEATLLGNLAELGSEVMLSK